MKLSSKLYISSSIVVITISFYLYPKLENHYQIKEIEEVNNKTVIEAQEKSKERQEINITKKENYLQVGFICQAPLQTEENWKLHEESCEEAAILQAYAYEINKEYTKEEANSEILQMIDWQNNYIGGHYDLYADELKPFAVEYFNIKESELIIKYDATIDDIKKILSEGHPVIAPVTSEYLNNPYYPYPGYHMLTVTGYTEDRLITNDNGTRRGEDFSYSYEDFEKAMNDSGADILYFNFNNN